MLNGCETSHADVTGLCQSLVRAGVPMALGWSVGVTDERAVEFAENFYTLLARGAAVPLAAAQAREFIRQQGRSRVGTLILQDPSFSLPQLYGTSRSVRLVGDGTGAAPTGGGRGRSRQARGRLPLPVDQGRARRLHRAPPAVAADSRGPAGR